MIMASPVEAKLLAPDDFQQDRHDVAVDAPLRVRALGNSQDWKFERLSCLEGAPGLSQGF